MNYIFGFVMFMCGVGTGHFLTLRFIRKTAEIPEGEMPAGWWECTSCGFTTSHEPEGRCPVCKIEGTPVPETKGERVNE